MTGLVNERELTQSLLPEGRITEFVEQCPPERKEETRNLLRTRLASLISAMAIEDARLYFALNGVTAATDRAVKAPIQVFAMLGEVVHAMHSLEISSVDRDGAVLKSKAVHDGTSTARALRLVLQSDRRAPEPPSEFEAMVWTDEGFFVFDRTTGLMRTLSVSSRSNLGTRSAVSTSEIRLLSAPQR